MHQLDEPELAPVRPMSRAAPPRLPADQQPAQEVRIIKPRFRSREERKQPEQTSRAQRTTKKLLFEWKNEDDTSQGALPMLSRHRKQEAEETIKGWQEKVPEEMGERDWRIYREDNGIRVRGKGVPLPIRQWAESSLEPALLRNVQKLCSRPKPVQSQAIPIGLAQRNLLALAPTGQGKTFAFLLPIMQYLLRPRAPTQGPLACVLVPTRQLAEQIAGVCSQLAEGTQLRHEVVIGGVQIELQAAALRRGVQILIGTPGRVRQMLERSLVSLEECRWTTLDQADCMVDEQLETDVSFILSRACALQRRVVHMFSATMNAVVRKTADQFLGQFIELQVGQGPKSNILHRVQVTVNSQKRSRLLKALAQYPAPRLVFLNTRTACQALAQWLKAQHFRVAEYHGGRSQEEREDCLEQVRGGGADVLVTTDLGARGLHIEGVSLVVSFEAPKGINDYIHRSGRTGRAGAKGTALTLLTDQDSHLFAPLKEYLKSAGQQSPDLERCLAAVSKSESKRAVLLV